MASAIAAAFAQAFASQLAVAGDTVTYGGADYQAIRRDDDEVFNSGVDANYNGYVRRITFEFVAAEAPSEGVTIYDGAEGFLVESLVLEKPHSKRFVVSRQT